MKFNAKKGQSIMEYVIVFTAIVAAVVVISALMKKHLELGVAHVAGEMQDKTESYRATYTPLEGERPTVNGTT
ncbi:MAG: hypothetical protein PHR44_08145 [Candidatus Omnitrophica bacterium]|nr:hypothetical protein [Candidatus Omnitrophota bacterium]